MKRGETEGERKKGFPLDKTQHDVIYTAHRQLYAGYHSIYIVIQYIQKLNVSQFVFKLN